MSFRPHPDVIARVVQPGGVLVHLEQNEIYEINATGMAIWDYVMRGLSETDIADRLAQEFDVSREEAESQVQGLLADLRRHGLVV